MLAMLVLPATVQALTIMDAVVVVAQVVRQHNLQYSMVATVVLAYKLVL
jgi:hypothetical protein